MGKRTLTDYVQDRIDLYEAMASEAMSREHSNLVMMYTSILDELDRLMFIIKLECEKGDDKKC